MDRRSGVLGIASGWLAFALGCGEWAERKERDEDASTQTAPASSGGDPALLLASDGHEGSNLNYANGHPLNWLTHKADVLQAEVDLFNLVNNLRVSQGRNALPMNTTMRRTARGHSRHMTAGIHDFFAHVNPEGDNPAQRMNANGIPGGAGENLAAGFINAQSAFDALAASPSHYSNMLYPNYSETGVGYQTGSGYGFYWAQLFR